jgi:hypothetical protein
MALVVIGYPKIDKNDYNWIQEARKKSDELYFNVVNPHFTFVFPVSSVSKEDLIKHCQNILSETKKFAFEIKKATTEKDAFNEYTHTFIILDKGSAEIIQIHDKLYTGILKPELREDIPYIPHIGIGNNKDPKICEELAKEINDKNISIKGTIDSLDIAVLNIKVKTIKKIYLR